MRERFEAKFIWTPGCWVWNAGFMSNGYGAFAIKRQNTGAHRVSYQLYVGEIPDGMHVLHRCDNKKCVNPEHLFVGTALTNMLDKEAKQRGNHPAGEIHRRSKLTKEQVLAIRTDPRPPGRVAKEYGVSMRNVRCIRERSTWKNV